MEVCNNSVFAGFGQTFIAMPLFERNQSSAVNCYQMHSIDTELVQHLSFDKMSNQLLFNSLQFVLVQAIKYHSNGVKIW